MRITNTREIILKSTLELIATRGLHDTPMSKIAKHAQISVGSIYTHFENKDDLIKALYSDIKSKIAEQFMKKFDPEISTHDLLYQGWKNMFEFYIHHQEEMDFIQHYESTPMAKKIYEEEFLIKIQPYFDKVTTSVKHGELKNLPPPIIATYIYDVIVILTKKHINGEIILDDNLLESSFNASWHAISCNI